MTLREHHSFIELPPPGFTPRRFNPRAGYFPATYRDYTAPLGETLDQRFILRHRLIKKDPNCIDRLRSRHSPSSTTSIAAHPNPSAPLCSKARAGGTRPSRPQAGLPDTFSVDILPAGADPMDVRYNIIQWVHRYTRGWSYGAAVADPRTGEIIKGNVTLGSLRGRQDYLIAEGLLAPYVSRQVSPTPPTDPMLQMVLARIRQLAAHETGHTLGLAHNFAASSFPLSRQSVSVMDYPHPWVTLDANGVTPTSPTPTPSTSASGTRSPSTTATASSTKITTPSKTPQPSTKILTDSDKAGQLYITDEDARPFGSAQPHAHLWDNGTDPAAELQRVLTIRAAALNNFGPDAIKPGTPMAQLEDTLVPLYLFHRYQTEAAIKEIGGLDYRYNVRGDGQPDPAIVSPAEQKKALAAVLKTLTPETLTLPESLLKILPPASSRLPSHRRVLPLRHRPHLRSHRRRRVRRRPHPAGPLRPRPRLTPGRVPHARSRQPLAALRPRSRLHNRRRAPRSRPLHVLRSRARRRVPRPRSHARPRRQPSQLPRRPAPSFARTSTTCSSNGPQPRPSRTPPKPSTAPPSSTASRTSTAIPKSSSPPSPSKPHPACPSATTASFKSSTHRTA